MTDYQREVITQEARNAATNDYLKGLAPWPPRHQAHPKSIFAEIYLSEYAKVSGKELPKKD